MIPDRAVKVAWLVATIGVVGVALTISLDKPWVSPHAPRDAGPLDATSADAAAPSPTNEPVMDLDGSMPPAPQLSLDLMLADATTRSVKVGVVLVQFAGAQGALPSARPKAVALELARKLADEAKTDFHQAVTHGDSGSADDIGRIGRGILEPQLEGVLFTLAPQQTSEPVETPRGYWVVKRLE